jgi:hypothetical protein
VRARERSFDLLYKELFDYNSEQDIVPRAIHSGISFIRHKFSKK